MHRYVLYNIDILDYLCFMMYGVLCECSCVTVSYTLGIPSVCV